MISGRYTLRAIQSTALSIGFGGVRAPMIKPRELAYGITNDCVADLCWKCKEIVIKTAFLFTTVLRKDLGATDNVLKNVTFSQNS